MKNVAVIRRKYNSLKEISRIQTLNDVNIQGLGYNKKKIYTYIKKKYDAVIYS